MGPLPYPSELSTSGENKFDKFPWSWLPPWVLYPGVVSSTKLWIDGRMDAPGRLNNPVPVSSPLLVA